ncbi:hemerythrin domain-containing protein [Nitrosophilus alvini]|uniref:hemerythrin domain-containing protein n=1 Tax=Nitrosophilus alvini TaxID=2714855 RepID=UPI00190C5AFE|nr:hemerythrin domain-containing protein [Nitrosophilus alvini]
MTSIKNFMTHDHRECDNIFAPVEEAVLSGNWDKALELFVPFHKAMLRHFSMEEEVLFPAIEEKTGTSEGPTNVMRMEHNQIKKEMMEMADAIEKKDKEKFLGHAETFMILVQQHNMKEEQILYNMAEHVLSAEKDKILEDMQKVKV